jgi:hypothetical protein
LAQFFNKKVDTLFVNIKKWLSFFILAGLFGSLSLLFQNATVVDFSKPQPKNKKLSAIEKAILKSDREQAVKQRRLGVAPHQTQKAFQKKKRAPTTLSDAPFFEQKKNVPQVRQKPSTPTVKKVIAETPASAAQ